MSDFEGLFGLFSIMFGLIVAELALKFADALDSNRERPMGILTPLLAFLNLGAGSDILPNSQFGLHAGLAAQPLLDSPANH